MSYTKKQIEEYQETYNQFSEDSTYFHSLGYGDSKDLLDRLHRYETSLHTINERWCNEEMSDKTVQSLEKREKNIEDKVKEISDKLGFSVSFNGDPRGGTIRFILPSGKSNNWDGQTWGIYW
jgi:dsDNA-specific endonuclease/ATPase MutS2